MKKALSLSALIVAVTLALAGCGSNGADSSSGSSVTHTQQDVIFATDMVPHHPQAVQMADTEIADGKDPDAVALAKSIKAAQTSEIATMKKLLAP